MLCGWGAWDGKGTGAGVRGGGMSWRLGLGAVRGAEVRLGRLWHGSGNVLAVRGRGFAIGLVDQWTLRDSRRRIPDLRESPSSFRDTSRARSLHPARRLYAGRWRRCTPPHSVGAHWRERRRWPLAERASSSPRPSVCRCSAPMRAEALMALQGRGALGASCQRRWSLGGARTTGRIGGRLAPPYAPPIASFATASSTTAISSLTPLARPCGSDTPHAMR